jgi:hypothetical protein
VTDPKRQRDFPPEEPQSGTQLRAPNVTHLPIAYPEGFERPRSWRECPSEWREDRGCPLVACRWNTFLDVNPNGAIQFNFKGVDCPTDLPHSTCSLEVAYDRRRSLDECGAYMGGISRERVRQIETKALDRFRPRYEALDAGRPMPLGRVVVPAKAGRRVGRMGLPGAIERHLKAHPGSFRSDVVETFSGSSAVRSGSVQTAISLLIRSGRVRSEAGSLWVV